MQNKKRTPLDAQQSHLWIIGGGIAGMAAAAFAIRDAKVPAKNIHILEELDISGGSMDGGHGPKMIISFYKKLQRTINKLVRSAMAGILLSSFLSFFKSGL